jgi:hypothetical protein
LFDTNAEWAVLNGHLFEMKGWALLALFTFSSPNAGLTFTLLENSIDYATAGGSQKDSRVEDIS